jgi:hypothetical protein
LDDEENLDEQFECGSSEDFTDDSNNFKNKGSNHSSSHNKKLIEVYSDNDLGSINNNTTNSNRDSPDQIEQPQKRKLYEFYSESENNLDDDHLERDEANSEHLNETHKDGDGEYLDKNQSETSDADNKSSYLGEASSLAGERTNGNVHKKKKTPTKCLTESYDGNNNNKNTIDGSTLEKEFSKNSSNISLSVKSDQTSTLEASNKHLNKNFLPVVAPASSPKGYTILYLDQGVIFYAIFDV